MARDLLLLIIIGLLIGIFLCLIDINQTLEESVFPRHYISNHSWDVEALVPGAVIIKERKE
jgi:hypothetical protein